MYGQWQESKVKARLHPAASQHRRCQSHNLSFTVLDKDLPSKSLYIENTVFELGIDDTKATGTGGSKLHDATSALIRFVA